MFPSDIVPFIGMVANLGLIFYVFLVGLELDPTQLRGRVTQAVAVSNTGVFVPWRWACWRRCRCSPLVGPDKPFVAFALFMGVSMSITAFPVLARIIVERRMLKRPDRGAGAGQRGDRRHVRLVPDRAGDRGRRGQRLVRRRGQDDRPGRGLLPAHGRSASGAARPRATAYDEAGRVPVGWIMAIFAGVLISAYLTEEIGVAVIFGAFVMGAVMPRHAGLTEDVTRRVEDFVVVLLLPLFFTYTGLRTNMPLLDSWPLVALTLVLLVVAIAGKFGGDGPGRAGDRAELAASRPCSATLMNTRGLTELIVLNLALEKGVISPALFAALVIMALITTFMAGPVLRLLDPHNSSARRWRRSSRGPSASPRPTRPCRCPSTRSSSRPRPTSRSRSSWRWPSRWLHPSRAARSSSRASLRPPRSAGVRGGLQTEQRLLTDATNAAAKARLELLQRGVAARSVALTSARPGQDLVKLAAAEEVDLVLVDGRRPLLGVGVPRGDVGALLRESPADVAVLVAREQGVVLPGPDKPVLVPFGGAEHDWAALELGAWLAAATKAPLQLLGTAEGQRSLANASLLVQRFAGVTAEPVLAEPGEAGVEEAAKGAGLLVVGLSERWRQEGLGPTRSDIARTAPAPIVFVRRGTRPGALAPRTDVTRFAGRRRRSPRASQPLSA